MPLRTTPLRERAGVQLSLCEEVSLADRVVAARYRLTSMRSARERLLTDEGEAHAAFEAEAAACLDDPVVSRLLARMEAAAA